MKIASPFSHLHFWVPNNNSAQIISINRHTLFLFFLLEESMYLLERIYYRNNLSPWQMTYSADKKIPRWPKLERLTSQTNSREVALSHAWYGTHLILNMFHHSEDEAEHLDQKKKNMTQEHAFPIKILDFSIASWEFLLLVSIGFCDEETYVSWTPPIM